ncbi:IS110 family transposase [Bacteroides sp. 224]|uniref:IS110 family transposase n=1 Tax=Bacteroides sp. 224 TaxID=2302936 RepID=UPI0013D18EB5|nr:IS110 family transposase [Bacteroides sp. 224]NDV67241.1 IS110 family transposase [Bacteroides sp. 224]
MKTCGLDVHKDSVFCGIYNGHSHEDVIVYSTLTASLFEMGEKLLSEGITQIAMESTGIYWIPVWNILESMGFDLLLVNPYLIKQMPGRKSDVKDAQWIATLLHKGLLRSSLVPSILIRELRCYTRKYTKLQSKITSILSEMERNLEMMNIRITSLVSNISGKSIRRVVKSIIDGVEDAVELEKLIHGRIRNTHKEKVRQSLEGFITSHHRFNLELLYEEYELIENQVARCLEKMNSLVELHYAEQIRLLNTLPGVSTLSAIIILAESGANMESFESSSKFAGWTGLRPRNDESAGKYKSRATTKGNKYFRSIIVQVAWAASRTKGSYFMEKHNRLAIRKSRKKALVAIARKITVIIWHVLTHKQVYNPALIPVFDKDKIEAKIKYHQKEMERLNNLVS